MSKVLSKKEISDLFEDSVNKEEIIVKDENDFNLVVSKLKENFNNGRKIKYVHGKASDKIAIYID